MYGFCVYALFIHLAPEMYVLLKEQFALLI